jgi:hypothetical protein
MYHLLSVSLGHQRSTVFSERSAVEPTLIGTDIVSTDVVNTDGWSLDYAVPTSATGLIAILQHVLTDAPPWRGAGSGRYCLIRLFKH